MTEITPAQMAETLRRCSGTTDCQGCPYAHLDGGKCCREMQQDAAALIEALDSIVDD